MTRHVIREINKGNLHPPAPATWRRKRKDLLQHETYTKHELNAPAHRHCGGGSDEPREIYTKKWEKREKRGKGRGSRMKIKRPTKKPADMISEDNSIYQTSRIQKMTSQSRDQCAFYSLFTTTMHALAIMHSTQKGIQLCNHFFFSTSLKLLRTE